LVVAKIIITSIFIMVNVYMVVNEWDTKYNYSFNKIFPTNKQE